MSSWKKAAKTGQRTYKERHQPQAREKLGLLEKKKDYKRRADDFNRKKQLLKKLRKKALNRNPDEFYFHMVNSIVERDVHHEIEKEEEHTPDQIKLMQTQDLRYVSMKRGIEAKKLNNLKAELHLLDVANTTENKHIFFVDSKKEAKSIDVAKRLETHPALVGNRVNRMRLNDLESCDIDAVDKKTAKALAEKKKKKYKEMANRIERERELGIVQRKLELKRHLTASSSEKPKMIAPATKTSAPVYKWTYQRKR